MKTIRQAKANRHAPQYIIVCLALSAVLGLVNIQAQAAPSENMPVWRLQVGIRVSSAENAGTDDDVRVQLNASNKTWLNYSHDDFEKGSYFVYDLKTSGIARVSDINYFYLKLEGDNGLLLKAIDLRVNGKVIFTKVFAGPGSWLDPDDGYPSDYFVSSSTLRTNGSWVSYLPPAVPSSIPRAEMESRLEAIVGDYVYYNDLYWGHLHGRAVEVTKKDSNTLHVDLDLAYSWDDWFNPEVDVDFDLDLSCSNGRIRFDVTNIHTSVDSDWLAELLWDLGTSDWIDDQVSFLVNVAFQNMPLSASPVNTGICPIIYVDSNGDVKFFFTTPLPLTVAATAEAEAEAETQAGAAATEELSEEKAPPISVQVETPAETAAWQSAPYALKVKSNQTEATDVEMRIELSALINLASAVIEVVDGNGIRTLLPQITYQENGTRLLMYLDNLAPGKEQTYTLSISFQSVADTRAQIGVRVMPFTATMLPEQALPVRLVTVFRMQPEMARLKGTTTVSGLSKSQKP